MSIRYTHWLLYCSSSSVSEFWIWCPTWKPFFVFHVSFFISIIPLQFWKKIIDVQLRAQFLQDIKAIVLRVESCWSSQAEVVVLWEVERKRKSCRIGCYRAFQKGVVQWETRKLDTCVMNTNGLEVTNKNIKDELTYRQLMHVMDFLQRSLLWVMEQSESRSDGPDDFPNPNKMTFALEHTRTTNDWTSANSWPTTPQSRSDFSHFTMPT